MTHKGITAIPDSAFSHPSDTGRSRQEFSVSFAYDVIFTRDVFDPDNAALADAVEPTAGGRPAKLLFVVDAGVLSNRPGLGCDIETYVERHADRLVLAGNIEMITGGERVKNDHSDLGRLLRRIHDLGLDRHSYFVIVGGGALQDMAGYAAAIAHRGIRVVRVPTTVASQNDSGVGVKCGVNAFGIKNFLGAFAPPTAVINDFAFIETLPARERTAGISEAVKVALIRDAAFFEALERDAAKLAVFERDAMSSMIRRSAELHLEHIATGGDPFEMGSARPLDFGHWAAHKLEALSGHTLRHAEAVAVGVALDTRYSEEIGLLNGASTDRVVALLQAVGLPVWHDGLNTRSQASRCGDELAVLDGIEEFREHLGGNLSVTMLSGIGESVEIDEIDRHLAAKCIDWLEARSRSAHSQSKR